ncbi:MAG TPA: hypothetical protein VHC48_22720 [Puia sp.]|nr:hypothetical protein [Puia sp.]
MNIGIMGSADVGQTLANQWTHAFKLLKLLPEGGLLIPSQQDVGK